MVPAAVLREMEEHAREGYPNEVCGILAGRGFESCRVCRVLSVEQSPVSYFMDSRAQFRVFREIRERGEKMLVIYHSHPVSEAFPSQKDVALAAYPDAVYVIISLLHETPAIRGFRILQGKVEEVAIGSL
ncbi:MAG: M67 family metallopeptidase [Thermodesulfovibrionales bacterium]